MTVTNPALPLSAADVERTCLPLEQATMLPGAAYTDFAVFEWERANFFRQGLDLRRSRASRSAGGASS